jgi:hypothetical protein
VIPITNAIRIASPPSVIETGIAPATISLTVQSSYCREGPKLKIGRTGGRFPVSVAIAWSREISPLTQSLRYSNPEALSRYER